MKVCQIATFLSGTVWAPPYLRGVFVSGERSYRVVVAVEPEPNVLSQWVKALRGAGYQTTGVCTFEDAKRQITIESPDILIANARLGAHHGLHLVHLARRESPDFQAVIIGDPSDVVLEQEAAHIGALFLPAPVSGAGLLSVVALLIGRPTRVDAPRRTAFLERRRGERRQTSVPWHRPERRVAERRHIKSG